MPNLINKADTLYLLDINHILIIENCSIVIKYFVLIQISNRVLIIEKIL